MIRMFAAPTPDGYVRRLELDHFVFEIKVREEACVVTYSALSYDDPAYNEGQWHEEEDPSLLREVCMAAVADLRDFRRRRMDEIALVVHLSPDRLTYIEKQCAAVLKARSDAHDHACEDAQ